jgi:hypothetical protein
MNPIYNDIAKKKCKPYHYNKAASLQLEIQEQIMHVHPKLGPIKTEYRNKRGVSDVQ